MVELIMVVHALLPQSYEPRLPPARDTSQSTMQHQEARLRSNQVSLGSSGTQFFPSSAQLHKAQQCS